LAREQNIRKATCETSLLRCCGSHQTIITAPRMDDSTKMREINVKEEEKLLSDWKSENLQSIIVLMFFTARTRYGSKNMKTLSATDASA
jgi:hypothetical protein